MVKRTVIGRSGEEKIVDLLKELQSRATEGSTSPAGNKVLDYDEDFYWSRLDGTEHSLREVDEGLADAQVRIDEAEGSLAETQVRLDDAENTISTVAEDLTHVETVVIPGAVAQLEAADQAAQAELSTLDGKLSEAEQDLAALDDGMAQLGSDLEAESQAREQLAQDTQAALADLDVKIGEAGGARNFYQPEPPGEDDDPAPADGDLWFDTNDQNKPHIRRDGEWLSARDDSFLSTARNLLPWDAAMGGNVHAVGGQLYSIPSGEMRMNAGVYAAAPDLEVLSILIAEADASAAANSTTLLPFQGTLSGTPGSPVPAPDELAIPYEGRPIGVSASVLFKVTGGVSTPQIEVAASFFDIEGNDTTPQITPRVFQNARPLDLDDPLESTLSTAYGATHIANLDGVIHPTGEGLSRFALRLRILLPRAAGSWAVCLSSEGRVQVPESGISAGAITEAKIASAAVSAAKIQTDAVTETKIAPDSITSPKIVAGAILADHIVGGAVTAGKIAADAVTASKIAAGAVETDHLDARAVTADKMAVGTITADSGIIGSLNLGTLTAGAANVQEAVIDKLWADGIAAKSITASRMVVSGAELAPNPYFDHDGHGWRAPTAGPRSTRASTEAAYPGHATGVLLAPFESGSATIYGPMLTNAGSEVNELIPVTPGETYTIRAWVRRTAGDVPSDRIDLRVYAYDAPAGGQGLINGVAGSRMKASDFPPGEWVEVGGDYTVPAGRYGITPRFTIYPDAAWSSTSADWHLGRYSVIRKVGAVLIENGAVSADKINAESVAGAVGQFVEARTDKLVAGTGAIGTAVIDKLWADGLAAKSITTSRLIASAGNLIENGGGEYGDLTSWKLFTMDAEPPAETGAKAGYRSDSASFHTIGEKFPVQAGQRYVLDVWLHWSAANVNTAIQIIWQNASGTQLSAPYPIWPKTAPAGLAYYSAEEVAPAGAAQAYIRVVPSHSSGSPGTTTFYNLRLRPMSGSTLIEPGAITTEKLTVTSDMSAAIVNAMTTNTKKLVVTEEAILNHATLIGQTVVDNINVQGKLIGTDGVFTGTVDFENVNVTGDLLAEKISGHHIYGTVVEGGSIITSGVGGGQVMLSNDAYIDGGSQASFPGIRVSPPDVSGYVTPPGIGPNENGMVLTGGRTASGGRGFMIFEPDEATVSYLQDGARSNVSVRNGRAYIDSDDGAGNQGQLLTTPNFGRVRTDAADGSYGTVEAGRDYAVAATRDPSGSYMSQIRSEGRIGYISAHSAGGLHAGEIRVEEGKTRMRAYSGNSTESGWVRAQAQDAELAYVDANNTYFSRIKADASEAFIFTRAGGANRYLSVDADGVWVKTNKGGSWKQYNLEETAQDSGWVNLSYASGFTSAGSGGPFQIRRMGGMIHLRGRVARTSGSLVAGTEYRLGTLSSSWRPAHTQRTLVAGGGASQWGRIEVSASTGEITIAAISGNMNWVDLSGTLWTAD